MALSTVNPSQTQAWQKLEQHFKSMQSVSMKTLFEQDPARAEKFHIQWNDFLIDYSKNRITEETTNLLLQLADEVQLKSAIQDYFSGEIINQTEGRAVLHTELLRKAVCKPKEEPFCIPPCAAVRWSLCT